MSCTLTGMFVMHPTKRLLIDTVQSILKETTSEKLTIEEVLKTSNISRGSLYHHFADFSELVEVAEIEEYSTLIEESILGLTAILKVSSSRDELVRLLREATKRTQSLEARPGRFKRIQILSRSSSSERMSVAMGKEQARLTGALEGLYREVLERGWGNSKLNPKAVGVFTQAYTVGKITNDFTEDPVDDTSWNNLVNAILETVIFPPKVISEE